MKNTLIQGKAKDWCSKCKNGTCYLKDSDSYICTDPYDNEERAIGAQSDIECTMFEPDSGRYPWGHCDTKIDVIYEDDKVRVIKVTGWGNAKGVPKGDVHFEELIKASKRKDDLIQDYREKLKGKDNEVNLLNSKLDKLGEYYRTNEKLIDNIQKVIFPQEEGSDYTYSYEEILKKVKDMLNTNKELTDKIGSLKNKIVNQQSTHYKQCARILELENVVSKLQSGEYDDILAKDIEIKSLQAKYEDAMAGWKGSMDTNDKLNQTISDLTESNENLTKMVERRDKWVEELKSDVDTLQNECLAIAEIAKRTYDESMEIKQIKGENENA